MPSPLSRGRKLTVKLAAPLRSPEPTSLVRECRSEAVSGLEDWIRLCATLCDWPMLRRPIGQWRSVWLSFSRNYSRRPQFSLSVDVLCCEAERIRPGLLIIDHFLSVRRLSLTLPDLKCLCLGVPSTTSHFLRFNVKRGVIDAALSQRIESLDFNFTGTCRVESSVRLLRAAVFITIIHRKGCRLNYISSQVSLFYT